MDIQHLVIHGLEPGGRHLAVEPLRGWWSLRRPGARVVDDGSGHRGSEDLRVNVESRELHQS